MSPLRALVCTLALGIAVAGTGCGDKDTPPVPPNPPQPQPDAGTEVTVLVRDLILNETNETGTPTTTEDKNLVDSEPADAFPESFFQ